MQHVTFRIKGLSFVIILKFHMYKHRFYETRFSLASAENISLCGFHIRSNIRADPITDRKWRTIQQTRYVVSINTINAESLSLRSCLNTPWYIDKDCLSRSYVVLLDRNRETGTFASLSQTVQVEGDLAVVGAKKRTWICEIKLPFVPSCSQVRLQLLHFNTVFKTADISRTNVHRFIQEETLESTEFQRK